MTPKIKKILIVILSLAFVAIILFLILIVFGLGLESPLPPNVIRGSHISSIQIAMEVYCHENNSKYFQSPTIPISIGEYTVPKDPEGKPYKWIDNTSDPQKFCVWAELEKMNAYFVASHCGKGKANQQPTSLDECCELLNP